jgi:phage terminase large subunit-like protein
VTPSALLDPSADALLCKRLVDRYGQAGAHDAIDEFVSQFTIVELAALAAHFPTWGRSKQLPPNTDWISFGSLAGRGWGKSEAKAQFLVGEIQAGRVTRIGGAAQNETKTIAAQVKPLVAASPPWCMPEWEATAMCLRWPNGATYLGFTPEAPEPIRSENFDMVWLSEIQSWPAATRDEAYANFLFACRIGLARRLWDATPKRGHPLLKKLLARGEADPARHIVRRGTMYENPHLTATAVRELEAEYGGTTKGREELLGEMLEESDNALVKQAWIDQNRRPRPASFERRIISIDPASTSAGGSDKTGMIDLGLAVDGQLLVFGNHTQKSSSAVWIHEAFNLYRAGRCDLILVETNKGNDFVFDIIALEARNVGLKAVKLGKDARAPMHQSGVIYVREVFGRGPKEDRAQPMATAYERGRISHVDGGHNLSELEDWLTTWEPQRGMRSPDAIDALAHGTVELIGSTLASDAAKSGFIGITDVARQVSAATAPSDARTMVSQLLQGTGGGWSGGGRI